MVIVYLQKIYAAHYTTNFRERKDLIAFFPADRYTKEKPLKGETP
jgi:hypothetical protein